MMNRKVAFASALTLVAGLALAQTAPQPAASPDQPTLQQPQPDPAASQGWPQVQGANPQFQNPGDRSAPQYPPPNIPATLTLKAGTYVTVRLNQILNSDHNHAGDAYSATLTAPVVVDGIVVAARGQQVNGSVTDAKKSGHGEKVSHLGIQLTSLVLVDGQQAPIQSESMTRNGPLSGRATIVGPETMLTFRINNPVTIPTANSAAAFRYVTPGDYQQGPGPGYRAGPPPARAYAPGYYPYGYPYPYPYYYPYWGPGFGFYFGPSFYFGGPRFFFRR